MDNDSEEKKDDSEIRLPDMPVDNSYEPEAITPVSTAIPPNGSEGYITWTASEFIEHNKSATWYVILILGAVILASIIWLWTRDKITAGTIIVVGLVLAIMGAKKPRDQNYKLDNRGIYIGEKFLPFNEFKSFNLIKRGAFHSLVFSPLKRFGVYRSVYFDPADEEKIMAILASYLPMEEPRRDLLDELMWKMRF